MKNALIIFAKNPILGKVKTRLAADVGNIAALKIYKDFMKLTKSECLKVNAAIHLFYDSQIEYDDDWTNPKITKHVQFQHSDLGERMKHAFSKIKKLNYQNIVIIGTDCPYLNHDIIEASFSQLNDNKVVTGPAKDGGFYLLGLKNLKFLTFAGIKWSTNSVLRCYLDNLKKTDAKVVNLQTLEDIDDLPAYKSYLNSLKSMNNNNL